MPPNRAIPKDALWRDIHIPKGVYCLLVLDWLKFTRFQGTKTSANKRFYNMSSCLTSVSDGMLVSYKLYDAINGINLISQFAGLTWLAEASALAAKLVRA